MSALPAWLVPCIIKLMLALTFVISTHSPRPLSAQEKRRVNVVVLGDIGRSPRMQYHALSLAKQGVLVEIIGYEESDLHPEVANHPNIRIRALTAFPRQFTSKNRVEFLLVAPLKVVFQVLTLWTVLQFHSSRSQWFLIQNPPSIPTIAIVLLVCFINGARLVIDWHNFGFSILALKLGMRHPLVIVSRYYEIWFGKLASAHVCVTQAMAKILRENYRYKSPVHVLHDRPPPIFQPLDYEQREAYLRKLPTLLPTTTSAETIHTTLSRVKAGKTKLLVSSTSWTPDEDFSILLDALVSYSSTHKQQSSAVLPELLIIITGKGALQHQFIQQTSHLTRQGKLDGVQILTVYFDKLTDYAQLLGCADLGISLHTSSSGVDLPMKVVDMFGAGLPVLGWGAFEAWPELVRDGHNGLSFANAEELAGHLNDLFGGNGAGTLLKRIRRGAMEETRRRWDDEWNPVCKPLFGLE